MEMNQLDSDSHLPPRKRLLNGFKKLNGSSSSSSPSPSHFASSSSTSNGSSSSSNNVQTRVDNLLASRFDQNLSAEELVEATRTAAVKAVKAAKAARALANEKALISTKAIAKAKRALELVDSFPKEVMDDYKVKSFRKKKHVPVEDLSRRLHRVIENKYPRVLRTNFEEDFERNKKQKILVNEGGSSSVVTGSMNDIADVVDSDGSFEGLESKRSAFEGFKTDEADSIPRKNQECNTFGKIKVSVKVKNVSLSICNTKDQENGASSESPLPAVTKDGVIPVISGSVSRKCQDLKAPECVKQNKAVRS